MEIEFQEGRIICVKQMVEYHGRGGRIKRLAILKKGKWK